MNEDNIRGIISKVNDILENDFFEEKVFTDISGNTNIQNIIDLLIKVHYNKDKEKFNNINSEDVKEIILILNRLYNFFTNRIFFIFTCRWS